MPTLLISVPLGVRYLATVIARPEPSESPTVVCTRPLPNVASSPTTTALLLSFSAPDRTSDALAVPLSTRTAMGTLFAQAPPSPAGKDPPELARRSNTNLDAEAPPRSSSARRRQLWSGTQGCVDSPPNQRLRLQRRTDGTP